MKQNKIRKQTLDSAQYRLEILLKGEGRQFRNSASPFQFFFEFVTVSVLFKNTRGTDYVIKVAKYYGLLL